MGTYMKNGVRFADYEERLDFFNCEILCHEKLVRSICAGILDCPDDVDDAVQDTFLSAWTKLETLKCREAARAWLCTIARRCALDLNERLAKSVSMNSEDVCGRELAEYMASTVPGPEEHLMWQSQLETARTAYEMLPEKYRQLIYLRFALCLDNSEISERMGMEDRVRINACSKARTALKINMAKLSM